MAAQIGTNLEEAAAWLNRGEVIAIPTETVYGLAGNAFDLEAVTKIYKVKNRPFFNPLIVHCANLAQIKQLVTEFPDAAKRLASVFWPGPMTLLLPKRPEISDLVTAGSPLVAVRIPQHGLTHELLGMLNFPLAAPSANPFGYVSPTTAQHVANQLGDQIPYILDGGSCQIGLESTIIGFDKPGTVTVYRLGGISVEDLMRATGYKVEIHTHENLHPIASGMLENHYAPGKRLYIGNSINQLPAELRDSRIGAIRFHTHSPELPKDHQFLLSFDGSLEQAAKNLFLALRTLDGVDFDCILAEPLPDEGLGKAINDRLRRASAK